MKRRKGASGDYEVGFGKPPLESRFRPGQSGNPRGRPKKSKNLESVMKEELQEPTAIITKGKHKTIPYLQAVIKQLKAKAVSGDLKALEVILRLAERYGSASQEIASGLSNEELDEAIVADFLSRQTTGPRGPGGSSDDS